MCSREGCVQVLENGKKVCSKCKVTKPYADFKSAPTKIRKDGHQPWCVECMHEYDIVKKSWRTSIRCPMVEGQLGVRKRSFASEEMANVAAGLLRRENPGLDLEVVPCHTLPEVHYHWMRASTGEDPS